MFKKDLLLLWNTLNKLKYDENQKQYIKFKYMVARNKLKLKPEIEIIQELVKLSPEFTEFNEKRVEICKEFSRKDENGEAILINNNYDIVDRKRFNETIETLKDKYKTIIQKEEEQSIEIESMLDENIDIEISKVIIEEVPGDLEQGIIDIFVRLGIITE